MLSVDFSILNQKATPAIYADTLALRPAASFAGRLFVDTASPYGIYRDTGSVWVQIAAGTGGSGSTGINGLNGTTNIGLGGTLSGNTTIAGANFNLLFTGNNILQQTCKVYNLTCTDLSNNVSQINAGNSNFLILSQQNSTGINSNAQDLFYASNATALIRFVKLGDFNNYDNKYSFIIDDANEFIKTQNAAGDNGFILTNSFTLLGSYNATNYLYLTIDYGNNSISTFNTNGTSKGLKLDFTNNVYQFGSYTGGGNYIQILDSTKNIELLTTNLTFTGAALQSNTSGGNSGEHLVITLNGTQYKIKLENP